MTAIELARKIASKEAKVCGTYNFAKDILEGKQDNCLAVVCALAAILETTVLAAKCLDEHEGGWTETELADRLRNGEHLK